MLRAKSAGFVLSGAVVSMATNSSMCWHTFLPHPTHSLQKGWVSGGQTTVQPQHGRQVRRQLCRLQGLQRSLGVGRAGAHPLLKRRLGELGQLAAPHACSLQHGRIVGGLWRCWTAGQRLVLDALLLSRRAPSDFKMSS